MLNIPDCISMDDLSKLWIATALKAIQLENEPPVATEDEQQE